MKSRDLLAILISLGSVLPAFADDLTSEGIKAYRSGDYSRAEQLYRQALSGEMDPEKRAAIYRNLGVLYQAQGKDGTEFNRQADAIDPPGQMQRIERDGDTMLLRGKHGSGLSQAGTAEQNESSQMPDASNSAPRAGAAPVFNGLNSSVSGSMMSSGGGFGVRGTLGNGSIGGGSIFGGYRNGGGYYPGRFGAYGPMMYSSQNGNNSFMYSTGTPMVLTAPNGRPVFINAPGPNIYSQTQAPDGSSSTLIYRTY